MHLKYFRRRTSAVLPRAMQTHCWLQCQISIVVVAAAKKVPRRSHSLQQSNTKTADQHFTPTRADVVHAETKVAFTSVQSAPSKHQQVPQVFDDVAIPISIAWLLGQHSAHNLNHGKLPCWLHHYVLSALRARSVIDKDTVPATKQ